MFTKNNISKFISNIPYTRYDDIKYFIHQMFNVFLYVESETDCLYKWDVKEKIYTFSQEMTAPPSFSWDTETLLFVHNKTSQETLDYIRNTLRPFREALEKTIPSIQDEDIYSYIMTREIERDIIKNCSKENVPLFDNKHDEVALDNQFILSFRTLEKRQRTYKDLFMYQLS